MLNDLADCLALGGILELENEAKFEVGGQCRDEVLAPHDPSSVRPQFELESPE